MFRLSALPPEIVLYILTYLPLQSLNSLRQTSKSWNQRFNENEPYIYRNAAYHHDFLPSTELSLEDAVKQCGKIVEGVTTWLALCNVFAVVVSKQRLTTCRSEVVHVRSKLVGTRLGMVQRACRRPRRCT